MSVAKKRKKIKEVDALKIMSDYYQANQKDLPPSVRQRREMIIELIMEGYPVEEAFSKVAS